MSIYPNLAGARSRQKLFIVSLEVARLSSVCYHLLIMSAEVPIDLVLELNAVVDGMVGEEQEARRKSRLEEESRLKNEELKNEDENRRKAEHRIHIIAHNERAREIAEISAAREFFLQAQTSLVRHYPSVTVVEGWGNHNPREIARGNGIYQSVYTDVPEFLKIMSDADYQNYYTRLAWREDPNNHHSINLEWDAYNYIEAEYGRDYYFTDERVIIHMFTTAKLPKYDVPQVVYERRLNDGEWQNREEIKRAVIEGIKSPLFHSVPRLHEYMEPRRPSYSKEFG